MCKLLDYDGKDQLTLCFISTLPLFIGSVVKLVKSDNVTLGSTNLTSNCSDLSQFEISSSDPSKQSLKPSQSLLMSMHSSLKYQFK